MTTLHRQDFGIVERMLHDAFARRDEPSKVLVGTWIATALAYGVGRLAGVLVGAASLRRSEVTERLVLGVS